MVGAMRQSRRRTSWRALLQWALALGLVAFTLVALASIGIWVAPFALAAIAMVMRRNRSWPDAALGGSIGVGSVCLLVAYLNRAYSPCPRAGTTIRLSAGQHFSCGGFDPVPWLAIGLVLGAAGLVGALVLSRTHRDAAT